MQHLPNQYPVAFMNTVVMANFRSVASDVLQTHCTFKTMDLLLSLRFPLSVAGHASVIGSALLLRLRNSIPAASVSRILQPFLAQGEPPLDLRPTVVIEDSKSVSTSTLNCLQLALLVGDEDVLNSLLSQVSLPDTDLHRLVGANGVNLFHAACSVCPNEQAILAAFKFMWAKQKRFGLFASLCYEEIEYSGWKRKLNVLNALMDIRAAVPAKFLLEKGVNPGAVSLYRDSSAPPSPIHAALCARHPLSPVPEFWTLLEPILLDSRCLGISGLLSVEYQGSSILAAVAASPMTNLLQRLVAIATQEQKDAAVVALASSHIPVQLANEKALLNSGADLAALTPGPYGPEMINCLMRAALQDVPERVLFYVQQKGHALAAAQSSNGRYPIQFAMSAIGKHSENLKASLDVLRTLVQPPAVRGTKAVLEQLIIHLQAREEIDKLHGVEKDNQTLVLDARKWLKTAK